MALSFFEKGVKEGFFDKAGVTVFDPIWAFEDVDINFEYIVTLGVQHDYEAISEAHNPRAGLEVMRQYTLAAYGAKWVTN